MSDNTTQPGIRIDEQLWKQFRQDVRDRHGTVRGHLSSELETALREYLNASRGGDTHDRLRRIEDRLDDLAEGVGDAPDSESCGGTDSVSKTTENRMGEILSDIQSRADELGTNRVRTQDVEAAIERNAGASYKTIQRYKSLLQNQRELFPHPDATDVFFVSAETFVTFIEQNDGINDETRDMVRGQYSDDWWIEHTPDGLVDEEYERGFQ